VWGKKQETKSRFSGDVGTKFMSKFLEQGAIPLFVRGCLEIDKVDVPCVDVEQLSCRHREERE
jgi:hypothetical protein